jgi:hypothetical protein
MEDEPEVKPPPHVPVTSAWREEMQRRQSEYAARRARWTNAILRGAAPDWPSETGHSGGRGRTIFDKRQLRFDF